LANIKHTCMYIRTWMFMFTGESAYVCTYICPMYAVASIKDGLVVSCDKGPARKFDGDQRAITIPLVNKLEPTCLCTPHVEVFRQILALNSSWNFLFFCVLSKN